LLALDAVPDLADEIEALLRRQVAIVDRRQGRTSLMIPAR
jgi:hypothetical protein